jgi:dTDP-4-amino-4,6-dideoxygalactose transaminase
LKPRGVIPVDLFGLPADYKFIMSLAQEHDLFVIEDAAQAFGATYGGRRAGALAHVGTTSFFPAKPLGCYGDGGAIFVDDYELAEIIRSVRVHGKGGHKYDNVRIGINGRLDTLQAAILLAKFSIFSEEVKLRQQVANRYTSLLNSDCCEIITPWVSEGCTSVWAQYSVLARDEEHRRSMQSRLEKAGIPTAIYYPKPLHLQAALSYLDHKTGDFPISEDCANRILSLPMHPYLTLEDQELIAKVIGNT